MASASQVLEGVGLPEMTLAALAMGLSVLIVAAVALKLLNDAGSQGAPFLVIAAGVLASGAVSLLR